MISLRALQDNLNLSVPSLAKGERWIGNQNRQNPLTEFDADNGVEIVRIDQPETGEYLLQIAATNLTKNATGQDFALVVSGDLGSPIRGW